MSAVAQPHDPHLEQRYNRVQQAFHWLVVALILVQLSTKLILPYVLPESAQRDLNAWHISFGTTILLVMLLRLGWRLTHPVPPSPSDLSLGLRTLSRATHYAFYAVLIVLPLLGWAAASAYGAQVKLFGFIHLPALSGKDIELGKVIGRMHGVVALSLLGLMALHISGVLYHAFIKKDGVAKRMLPG